MCSPSGSTVITWIGLYAKGVLTNENKMDGWRLYDSAPDSCHMIMSEFEFWENESSRNLQRGFRVNNQCNQQVGGSLKVVRNIARGNGWGAAEGGSGGFVFGSFVCNRTVEQVALVAFLGPTANPCYIGENIAEGNRGMNQAMSTFGIKGFLIELNQFLDQSTPGNGPGECPAGILANYPGCFDGACLMLDENSDDTIVQRNVARGCLGNGYDQRSNGQGITVLRKADRVWVRYNTIQNARMCIEVEGPVSGIKVYGNTATGCTLHGLRHTVSLTIASPSEVQVQNNLVVGVGAGVGYYGESRVAKPMGDYNLIFGFGTPYKGQVKGAHDLNVDPQLDGLKLKEGSPARKAGVDLGYRGLDIEGRPLAEGKPDLGAYEFQTTPTPVPYPPKPPTGVDVTGA
jgi:hypothetical protein